MKIPFKFTAKIVDQIEKNKNVSIEALLGSTTVSNLTYFIEKAFHNTETDRIGVSNDQAMETLGEYLLEHDKEDLLLDIMEALQVGGFLSRKINIDDMRKALTSKTDEIKDVLAKEATKVSETSGAK